jgi:hypothetical protein
MIKHVDKSLIKKATALAEETRFQVETQLTQSIDDAKNKIDKAGDALLEPYYKIVHSLETLKILGVTISAVVAPVPTFVGLGLIWYLDYEYENFKENRKLTLEDKKKDRELNRIVKQLNKYGKIPETAIVETEYLILSIDTKKGQMDGVLKQKGFLFDKETKLSDITDSEIIDYGTKCQDSETLKLLDAYLNNRNKINLSNKDSKCQKS